MGLIEPVLFQVPKPDLDPENTYKGPGSAPYRFCQKVLNKPDVFDHMMRRMDGFRCMRFGPLINRDRPLCASP